MRNNRIIIVLMCLMALACQTFAQDNKKVVVALNYGSDSGILKSGYARDPNLDFGDGSENVATIHVMFASSAYGHIAAGGALGNDAKYHGGEGSTLAIDNFKLIY